VVINFSSPQASLESMEIVYKTGMGIVIGTTGLSPEQIEKVKEFSKGVRIVFFAQYECGNESDVWNRSGRCPDPWSGI